MSNVSRSVNKTTRIDESPIRAGRSDEEHEVAAYLDGLISATLADRAPGRFIHDRGTNEPASADLGGEEPEATAPPEPTPEAWAPGQQPPPPSRQTQGTTRASMREELMARFDGTGQLSPPLPSVPADVNQPRLPIVGPSEFFRRFLAQAARSPELAPSGLASLDARLAGGFGSGLHLVSGLPGVGKTAFLESMAWEAVSSERPVLYYALKERSIGAWGRLVSTLGNILGGPAIPLGALRARTVGPGDLETLTRLDRALQVSVLPWLSLVETIPAYTDTLSAFIEDVRLRAQKAEEQQGRIPLLLVDDLERLLLLTQAGSPSRLLARLNDALAEDSLPGLLAADSSAHGLEGLPAQAILALVSAPASANDASGRVDLELLSNARTGWTGTLPLILDRRSGLFTLPSISKEREPFARVTTVPAPSSRSASLDMTMPPSVEVVACPPGMRDLAPMICRQRLVIEGTCRASITEEQIRSYLSKLSDVCEMRLLIEPVTHRSDRYGWAGWVHWENSGAHFYAWETPKLFFSVDVYTCKPFDANRASQFTKDFFDAPEIVAMAF